MPMMITLTERAAEAVAAAETAARRFNPAARVRLARDATGGGVRFELVEGPEPGDATMTEDRFTLLVAHGLDGVLDTGEHNAPFLTLI